MRYDAINHTSGLFTFQLTFGESFLQRTTDETIFSIRNGLFAIFAYGLGNLFAFLISDSQDFFPIRQIANDVYHLFIIFQQFDGKESGRIFVSNSFVLGYDLLDFLDTLFQYRTVIHVDMTENTMVFGILLFRFHILMPCLHIVHHFIEYLLLYIFRNVV